MILRGDCNTYNLGILEFDHTSTFCLMYTHHGPGTPPCPSSPPAQGSVDKRTRVIGTLTLIVGSLAVPWQVLHTQEKIVRTETSTIRLLPEWCNDASKAHARFSSERCSSVHASAIPLDCQCRVLNTPRQRVVVLRYCATHSFQLVPESESWPSRPSQLLQPGRTQEIGLSTSVLGQARTAHLPSSPRSPFSRD